VQPMSQWNSPRQTVNPNMVILARESRGLSQQALADALEVGQSYVSKIETGVFAVSDEKLEALSRALDYPPHFFFQGGSLLGVGISEMFHRKRQDVPQKVLSKIHACVEIRIRNLAALLRVMEMTCDVPHYGIDEFADPEDIARMTRAHWHMSRGPVQDVVQTLESMGVMIVEMDFETTKVDAISRWIPGLPPIFFVNVSIPKDRLRYTLAHELGHMVMHDTASPNMEDEANLFAAEFLMPAQDVRADLAGLTLPKLAQMKRYWKVAMTALLVRAEQLETISMNKARSLWAQISAAGYKTHEPIELSLDGEHPMLLHQLVEAHLARLGYTPTEMAKLLPLNERELWSFYLRDQSREALPRPRKLHAVE